MQYILLVQFYNFFTIKEKSFTCYIHTVCLKVFMIFFQNNTIYHLCPHICCTICTFFVIISIFSTSFLHILSHFLHKKILHLSCAVFFPCSIPILFLPRPPLHPFHIGIFRLFPVTSADIHRFSIFQQQFLSRAFLHTRKIDQKAGMASYKIIARDPLFDLRDFLVHRIFFFFCNHIGDSPVPFKIQNVIQLQTCFYTSMALENNPSVLFPQLFYRLFQHTRQFFLEFFFYNIVNMTCLVNFHCIGPEICQVNDLTFWPFPVDFHRQVNSIFIRHFNVHKQDMHGGMFF